MKKIVDLSFISYFPADNGGKQAIFYRLSAMARMNKVYAISINSEFDVIDITFKDNYMKNMEYIIIVNCKFKLNIFLINKYYQ